MDIFFYEAFPEEESELRRLIPPGLAAGFARETAQETGHTTPPAPLLSIRTQSRIPAAWAPALRGILARTTGYDHLLRWRSEAGPGPALAALPSYCSRAVAEQACLLWMALLRRLPAQLRQFDRFHRAGLTGGECAGRTLLVAGVGRIGHEIARIGRGLDMTVLGVDPVRRHPDVEYAEFAAALPRADVIVASMNLTAANRAFFNRDSLAGARPGALFVNVARGELSPPGDLLALLEAGRLGGVALDVYDHEDAVGAALREGRTAGIPPALLALRARGDVILTPHNAFNTAEAVVRKSELTVQQALHFLQHGRFAWPLEDDPAGMVGV